MHNRVDMASVGAASRSVKRIQSYIDKLNAKTYLEIGVCKGSTFLHINASYRIAVDPNFRFNPEQFANDDTVFYSMTSNKFFKQFKALSPDLTDKYAGKPFKFDVIFLDGLHEYKQTLLDFENSLAYSHEKTVWVFDDTVPSNCFAAINSPRKASKLRKAAGLAQSTAWQGDVFKVIFAIHDKYPEFSYCTHVDAGNPQTILWRTDKPTNREKVFEGEASIMKMRYEDFIDFAWVCHPVNDDQVLEKLFTNIDPRVYKTGGEHRLVIKPIVSDELKRIRKSKSLLARFIKLLCALFNWLEKK